MRRSPQELVKGAYDYCLASIRSASAQYHATLLHNEYHARRRHYELRAAERGLAYSDSLVKERTQRRLADRGLERIPRERGDIHTLSFFPLQGWHVQLVAPLRALGHLHHFDSRLHLASYSDLLAGKAHAVDHRRRICDSFERIAKRAVARHPVDWVFVYATGAEILVSTIERVRDIVKAPVVGMCLDDKQSWQGPMVGGQDSGQISLAPHLDLAWTSSRVACEWYMVEGGNPVFLPEGCDPEVYSPDETPQDLDISFVGQAYGFRRAFIDRLRSLGLRVKAAGPGWPDGAVSDADLVRLFRRSKIVLGHGGIGWSEEIKNTKGRDFDAPAVGMGAYLTSFNPELTEFFDVGREILCYSSIDECYEVASRLLRDDLLRRQVARAGRDRCLREHTWVSRFEHILSLLGTLSG